MGLSINNAPKMPLEWASLDETTKAVSTQIFNLANGLTPSQFCEAIEFALFNLSKEITLKFPVDFQ